MAKFWTDTDASDFSLATIDADIVVLLISQLKDITVAYIFLHAGHKQLE